MEMHRNAVLPTAFQCTSYFDVFPFLAIPAFGQEPPTDTLYQLALAGLSAFSRHITAQAETDPKKAEAVVDWYARHFDWTYTYTGYQKRRVKDILEWQGGNCNELAMVTKASLETLGVKMRRVREINLHVRVYG